MKIVGIFDSDPNVTLLFASIFPLMVMQCNCITIKGNMLDPSR